MREDLAVEAIRLREKEIELRTGLPFLYGWKWYQWAFDFFHSTNKINLLCAANQISKSSTQIRKCIDWATNKDKWASLWVHAPRTFWYFYPTQAVATVEFEKKWSLFLPFGKYKDDPVYGWKAVYKQREVHAIHFNSGVTVYFKAYSQNVMALQTATIDVIFADEELPVGLYDELMVRLTATNGYFHMVFTATIGQEFWRLAMEPEAYEKEALATAFKLTVSMYDCLTYIDGSNSHWTRERIKVAENNCKNDKEILKRIHGKFVKDDSGRKCEQFSIQKHMRESHPLPQDWLIYSGVDIGSGGASNHPAAIVFLAVRPDYQAGRVFLAWRGDKIETTAGDVMNKFIAMRTENHLQVVSQVYDWGSKDFETIADRIGEPFEKADKGQDRGADLLNVLFKNNILLVYEDEETQKLATELISLRKETPKNKAKDDLYDALRYAAMSVPWDFTAITVEHASLVVEKPKAMNHMEEEINERRKEMVDHEEDAWNVQEEIEFWNQQAGTE